MSYKYFIGICFWEAMGTTPPTPEAIEVADTRLPELGLWMIRAK